MSIEEVIEAAVERAVHRALERRLQPQSIAPELLTIQQAALAASVSEATVRQWLKGGALKRYGTGRTVRVRRDELLSLTPSVSEPNVSGEEIAAALLGKR